MDHHLIGHRCTGCGAIHIGVFGMNTKEPPKDGDVTTCGVCGAVSVFRHNPRRIEPLSNEYAAQLPREDREAIFLARYRLREGRN